MAVSMSCSVPDCSYVTEPLDMKFARVTVDVMCLHMSGAHPNNKFEKSEYEEDSIEKKDDPDEHLTCKHCYKIFFSAYTMKRHVKTEHNAENRMQCAECVKSFASKFGLEYHMKRQHSDNSAIQCERCGENFADFKLYVAHKNTTHGLASKVEHKCSECNKTIVGKMNLNRHKGEVHGKETRFNTRKKTVKSYPFKCDECEFFTKRKFDLKVHKQNKHSGVDVQFPCNVCTKTFKYQASLKVHMKKCG